MTESVITAALVGVIMALIKVIEHLVARRAEARKPVASPYNGHCPHAHALEKTLDKFDTVADKLVVVADRLDRET